jgi:hypothetical protein
VFFAWKVPETKNRSLEQIEREIRGESQVTAQQLRERRQARRDRHSGPQHRTPLAR